MDKRLEKRHKRQVERARTHKKVSEPDVRTPEQIHAAREAGHALSDHRHPLPPYVAPGRPTGESPVEEEPSEQETA